MFVCFFFSNLETYCDYDAETIDDNKACQEDFSDCVNDEDCCTKLCIIPILNSKGYCFGTDPSEEFYFAKEEIKSICAQLLINIILFCSAAK